MNPKEKLFCGYDPHSQVWIVGPKTERGTIDKIVTWFGSAEDAQEYVDKINNEGK